MDEDLLADILAEFDEEPNAECPPYFHLHGAEWCESVGLPVPWVEGESKEDRHARQVAEARRRNAGVLVAEVTNGE